MRWEKKSSRGWKVYKGNGIIDIHFVKKSSIPGSPWILIIHAWDIPNYQHEIYQRFNEKRFLEITENIIYTDNKAKNCILNAIFRGPRS